MKVNLKNTKERAKADYQQYRRNLVVSIGVGDEYAISLTQLIEKLNLTHLANKTFRKGINRELRKIEQLNLFKLIREKRSASDFFYWDDEDSKFGAIKSESPKWESHAHAMAYSFVEEHLIDFLPPSYVIELQEDFDLARAQLVESNKFRNKSVNFESKLLFHPSGYDLQTKMKLSDREHSIIYTALDECKVIVACYDSIHPQFSSKLTLSPQRLVYLNHQILLLCYEHETKLVKYFEINRLKKIQLVKNNKQEFQYLDLSKLETKIIFKARVHTWVKNYFDNVRLGAPHNTKMPVHEGGESWIIESEITLPNHFNSPDGFPDPFFFANFIGIFADSMEVLQPQCLRDEMIRRALAYSSLYLQTNNDNIAIISKSPHEMAGSKLDDKKI